MNYKLLGYALAAVGILWLIGLFYAMDVDEKLEPLISRLVIGDYDWRKMSGALRWK